MAVSECPSVQTPCQTKYLFNYNDDSKQSCGWKHAESEALYVEVLATQKRVLGDEHPDTLITAGNLAYTSWYTVMQQGTRWDCVVC